MRQSKLSQSILTILTKHPTEELHIYAIAKELGNIDNLDRKSSIRASISRCLNRMQHAGLVDFEYLELYPGFLEKYGKTIPNKHAGKYWRTVRGE